jgi:hypothetical protein
MHNHQRMVFVVYLIKPDHPVSIVGVYDDYRFVTRDELSGLGLGHLVGTPLLRAYMHGFFMDARLYAEAKAVAEPFAYEKYRKV